jgi:hypothetical protein
MGWKQKLLLMLAALSSLVNGMDRVDDMPMMDNDTSRRHDIHLPTTANVTIFVKRNFVTATFGSNMVIQSGRQFRVWGFSKVEAAGITVTLGTSRFFTVSGPDGFWSLQLAAPPEASLTPTSLEIKSSEGVDCL